MLNDFRYATRGLRRAPIFTAAAVATLALGVAVNTIVFTIINSLAFRPMPVRDAGRIVRIYPVDEAGRRQNLFSYPDYVDLSTALHAFEGMAGYMPVAVTAADRDEPREALAYMVSSSYFPLLGMQPSRGRAFTRQEEDDPGAGRVAIISHALWTRQFGGRENVLGTAVTLNGQDFTIVGVGPARFMGTEPLAPDFWVPLSAQPIAEPGDDKRRDRNAHALLVIGRLRAGVSADSAEQSLSIVAEKVGVIQPGPRRPARVMLAPGTFFTAESDVRPLIRLVLGIVALVLVIASANIANLVLTRAAARRKETTVRIALGASRMRLARQLLAESLLISVAGGIAGLLISSWVLRLLYPIGVSLLPYQWATVVLDLTPDVRVFAYTLALALTAGAMFGLAPLLQTSLPSIAAGLRDQSAIFGRSVRSSKIRNALVVMQIAGCLMLLAAAALATRTLQRTQALDLGFSADGVVRVTVDVERHHYTRAAAGELYRRLIARASGMPGVRDVALTSHVPLTDAVRRTTAGVEGLDAHAATDCTYTAVSPGYFRTLSIPIIAGRDFTAPEAAANAPVAIISDALARRFWPGVSAVGKRVTTPLSAGPLTIVGVARDANDVVIWREKEIALYVPAATTTAGNMSLLVRTEGDVDAVRRTLRSETAQYDRSLRFEALPLESVLRLWILPSRVAAIAAAVLGAIALAMASIGIYGVIAYTVSQRTTELGVRVALGADPADVKRLVLADGARVVAAGIAVGLVGAVLMTRAIASVLPYARGLDPTAFAAAIAVIAGVGMVACYLPARAAARVDPLLALRAE
jgi:predicted permease